MTCVAGADGCKSGWVVVLRDVKSGQMEVKLASRVEEILRWKPRPVILGIDMPIGLLDHAVRGGRECDKEARKLLGKPRGSSVFSPPARATLKAQTCDEADTMNRATDPHAPGISRQACAIIPKIREVDGFITRSLQRRVVEVHPELSFYEMNRRTPIVESKKSTAGRARRIQLLTRRWERKLSDFVDSRLRGVGPDDILDAMAVCWTAERVLKAKAVTIPRHPPHDSRGLRMEIVR